MSIEKSSKPPAWFSRRNQTPDAFYAHQAAKRAKWAAQDAALLERAKARASRSDAEQLSRLDNLLGKGVGAKKERARLAKRINK